MTMSAIPFLLESQNPDGGWGYAQGDASTVEATAAVVMAAIAMAGRGEPTLSGAREGALQWLRGAQHRDGGWGLQADDDESGWQTAWAVLALAGSGGDEDAVARGVGWLLAVKTIEFGKDAMQKADQALGIDLGLRGWPWLPDQASWVEPTALAVLALAAGPATPEIKRRTDEAVTYLTDRRCLGGGWNVGNPLMFSQALPARAHPTAWVLLALARAASGRVAPEDRNALRAEMESDAGAPAWALGALALSACGQDAAGALSQLQKLQQPDGSWDGNPFHTALAMLALAGGAGL
jgi:Squalene-hopene cyclase C-terminal domain